LIEGAESESITFTPLDTFPPSAPDPVTVASANGIISVFWPSAPERDVAGYNLYRAEQADATGSQWVKLNDQLLKPLTYRDERVIVDRKYFYRVTAVDIHGNQSAPTKVVSETAHP
jgi:fibronectin type 3 domain-containing protein